VGNLRRCTRAGLAHAIVALFCDVKITVRIKNGTGGRSQSSGQDGPAIARESIPISGNRADVSGRIHAANEPVSSIGNVNVVLRVNRNSFGSIQLSHRRRPAVPNTARGSCASDGGDNSISNFSNSVVASIGDQQIAGGIETDSEWAIE